MIKILHIIKSLGRGGAEMLLPETLKYHNKAIFEFHYIYFLPWKNQMVEDIEKNGGIVSCFKSNNNAEIFLKIPAIVKYIKDNNIKLVHCHLPWAGIAGRMAGKLAGVPVVYTEHNNFSKYHLLTRVFSRLTLNLNNLIIPVSSDAEQALKKVVSKTDKIKLVLNGVDTEAFSREGIYSNIKEQLNIPGNNLVITTAAVFRKQKRLDNFIRVASKVLANNPNVNFILIGDGPEKPLIEQLAKELTPENKLFFAGIQQNVKPYFAVTDIYLMTSDFEGLPIALLEAMSMSCAPVATNVGGIPEVIEHNTSGLLSKAGDIDDLAKSIELLVHDSAKRSTIAGNARKRIEKQFSMRRMVNELEDVYNQIIANGVYSKNRN